MEYFTLKLPKKCSLEHFEAWQKANPDWQFVRHEDGKMLQILEKSYFFADFDFIEIRQVPKFRFTDRQSERLCRLNKGNEFAKIEIDFSKPQTLQIHMGTALITSLFTGAIYASLYLWARKNKQVLLLLKRLVLILKIKVVILRGNVLM